MQVSISITPTTAKLGDAVTVTYSATDCADVFLNIDNYPGSISLGGGPSVSGSMKFLPLTDGDVTVKLTGSGWFDRRNDSIPEITQTAVCRVS